MLFRSFEIGLREYLNTQAKEVMDDIEKSGQLEEKTEKKLGDAIEDYKKVFEKAHR